MFISLLCIHVKIHCAGICPIKLVTVVSLVSRVVSQRSTHGYKRRARVHFEEHPSTEDMALSWCSRLESSRPPDMCRFPRAKDARKVLASDKGSLCCLTLQPHCSLLVHSRHHPPATTLEEGSLCTCCPWVCHTLGISKMKVPKN